MPSGSHLALYDGTDTDEAYVKATAGYNRGGGVPYNLRSPHQIAQFFAGLQLVEPVGGAVHRRPEPSQVGAPTPCLPGAVSAGCGEPTAHCAISASADSKMDSPSASSSSPITSGGRNRNTLP